MDVRACALRRVGEEVDVQIEPRAMNVLLVLCREPGKILSADDLLRRCWDGVVVGENQAQKAVAQLRRVLGDTANAPRYIENIRKRGYRTVAPVSFPPHLAQDEAAETWSRQSPYVGLAPFDAARAAVFFGREGAVARLRAALAAQVDAGRALVLVLGASGSGKTSLILAGLLPSLMREPGRLRVTAVATLDLGDVGVVPLPTALGGALLDLEREGRPLFAGHSAESLGLALTGDGPGASANPAGEGAPSADPMPSAAAPAADRFVLFVDRLEALFSPGTGGALQRGLFLTALDRLARGGQVMVIAACRNDYYADLAREPVLMEGKAAGGHFDLAPPSRTEIAQMIRLPAEIAGLRFGVDPATGEHLDDLLCEGAAGSPDALPLLQYTLQQLYLQRSPARELTMAAYRALGGMEGAIGRRADAILGALPLAAQSALPRVFSRIVVAGATDGAVRGARAPWSALTNEDELTLVRTLVEERLFVSLIADRQPVFGVAHEALLRQWPRAVAWIAAHQQDLRTRGQLEGLARQWEGEGHRADRLLRAGKPLEEARDLLARAAVPLSAEAKALITASIRQARRADRWRLAVSVAFAVIAAVALFLGFRARQAESVAALRLHGAEDLVDYMLGDLAEKLRPLGRLDVLDGVAQKALGYLTVDDAGQVPAASRLRQAKALQTLADVDRARGNLDAALKALDRADALLRANLAQGPVEPELLKTLGTVAFWYGQIALDQGRIDEAERRFTQYRDHAQRRMTLAPEEPDGWVELSYALSSLGTLQLRQGEVDAAVTGFETSIALKRRALERRPEDRTLAAELANSLSWLANAEAQRGRLAVATTLYDQQHDVLDRLQAAEPAAPVWTYRMALADKLKASLLLAQGRPDEALAGLDGAAEAIDAIIRKEPNNQRWLTERIALRLGRVEAALALGQVDVAVGELTAAQYDIDQMTKAGAAGSSMRRQQAWALLLRARMSMRDGRLDQAETMLTRSKEMLDGMGGRDQWDEARLSAIQLARADALRRRGDATAAEGICQEVASRLRAAARSSADFRILDPWVRAAMCAGDRQGATPSLTALERMGYRDPDFQEFLTSQKD
ncbi:winged helix-turn-helix domain-containing protein [Nitrospirillum iridis]|uniref:DNA-binding winged helix-turn-helix (WHTH) protein/tetratricopeptide (TPR) repeat protein n=1 Tax=Nitrospirillum iridis TaxID=765888 RepID=A0A7X0AXK2_9PROT|nr:DNA-binding winged helix-turn-helix (wHTH) protein/tetratricopeptide (TPR) repeat protein [Nitrospirillum iridis]